MFNVLLASAHQGAEEPIGGGVVWVLGAAIVLGLYALIRRTQRRAETQYWERKDRDEKARRDDPDMRPLDD
ncbi:MAG: hypothetical protein IIC71_02280 [Acidobacteria bacterium]|nr:hypothetical protein [Acidobacteriota bacterium]